MRVRMLVAGVVLALLFLGAGSANAAILYEQIPSGPFSPVAVSSNDTANPALRTQGADDFTVPDGQVWTVQAVDVFGLASGGSGTDTGNVFLYDNAGTVPGNQLFAQTGIGLTGGTCNNGQICNFTAQVTGAPKLSPGPYWASVQARPGGYLWFWDLIPPPTTFGNPAVWKGSPGCASGFGTLLGCGVTNASQGKDFIFRLNGELIDSRFNLGSFTGHSKSSLGIDATFPGAGTAVLKDAKAAGKSKIAKHAGSAEITVPAEGAGTANSAGSAKKKKKLNVKKLTRQIDGAGTQSLKIKLTKRAKKKLNKGHKVKLRVVVTFTATGGVPYSLTSGKLTLVPR